MGKLITWHMAMNSSNYNTTPGNQFNLSVDSSTPYRSTNYWIGETGNDYDMITMSYMAKHKSSTVFSWLDDNMLLIAPFAYGYKLGTTTSGEDSWGSYAYVGPGIPFSKIRTGVNNRPTHSIYFDNSNLSGKYSGNFYYLSMPATHLTMPSSSGLASSDRYKYFDRLVVIPSKGYLDGGSNNEWKLNLSAFSKSISSGSSYKFAVVYFEMYMKNTTTGVEKTSKGWMLGSNHSQNLFPMVFTCGNGGIYCGGRLPEILPWFYNFNLNDSFTYSIRLTGIQTGYTTLNTLNTVVVNSESLTISSNSWASTKYSTVSSGGITYNLCWQFRRIMIADYDYWKIEIEYYIKSDPEKAQDDYYVYDRNGGYKRTWTITMKGTFNPGSTITYDEARFPWNYGGIRYFILGFTSIRTYCSCGSTWGFSTYSTSYTTEFLKTIYQYMHGTSGYPWTLHLGTFNNKAIDIIMTGHG